jgi:hypothetical protein
MTPLQNLTVEQLRKLILIKEQIETLQGEIEAIAGGGESSAPDKPPGTRKMSRSEAARIAVAARWAKARAANAEPEPKKRRKVSAAARARLSAAAKKRWAKAKAQGKSRL